MTKIGTSIGLGITAICAAVVLSGCGAPGASYTVLDEPASAKDALPTDLPDYAFDEVDPASARSVGVHDATSLWLLRGTDQSICLFAYADSTTWFVACGGETGVTTSGEAGHFQVVPDGAPEPSNGTRVSDNVYALG